MRIPHTACARGKRVRVKLRDGTVIDGKFHDRTDRYVVLANHGKIAKADIQSFFIVKEEHRGR